MISGYYPQNILEAMIKHELGSRFLTNRDFSWNHRRLPDHCIQLAVSSSVGRGLYGGYIELVWETNYDSQ
jgi:hypothetical protein